MFLLDLQIYFVSLITCLSIDPILTSLIAVTVDEPSLANASTTQGFELSREARAQADLKFTYVVSCQIYGQQKLKKTPEAADIGLLLQRHDLCSSFLFSLVLYSPNITMEIG